MALPKFDIPQAMFGRIAPRQGQHLLGHIHTVDKTGRSHLFCGQEDIDPTARTKIKHHFTGTQCRNRGWVTTA